MKYESTSSGLLKVENVKNGDKLRIVEDAYSTFSAEKQKTYWNAKVQLPDGTVKLAGLMEMSCDKFAEKWGNDTSAWTGYTVAVEIKTSKAGNPYIVMVPTDDPKIEVPKSENTAAPAGAIEYPADNIKPEDIPF